MGLIVAVWDGFHLLSLLITVGVLALNGWAYGVLRAIRGQLAAANQGGTAYAERCRLIGLGIVVRAVAHLTIVLIAAISLTQGGAIVALLPEEVLWSYLAPILAAYNLFVALIGLLSVLALLGVIALYGELSSDS